MSDTHDDVIAKNTAWWAAHSDFLKDKANATAASLALSVVHWHHNVEGRRRRYGKAEADSDEFFLRQYAISATRAWLAETQVALEALGPTGPTTWYQKRDLEVHVRVLQHALDDFEWNTRNPDGAK